MILSVFIVLLSGFYFGLFQFFERGWKKANDIFRPSFKTNSTDVFVSIVVAARNEESNIAQIIEDISKQNYPSDFFEIIIVNDNSTDKTKAILEGIKMPNLQVLHREGTDNFAPNKKGALELAISKATGKYILVTDADCRVGINWLQDSVNFMEKNDYVFSGGMVRLQWNSFWGNTFEATDFATLNAISAASIALHKPNMANAANMMFLKSVFEEVNGYRGNEHLPTGDDEFLLHKISQNYLHRIGFRLAESCSVYTQAAQNATSFIEQRKRWVSKSFHYTNSSITAILATAYVLNLLIVIALLMLPFNFVFFVKGFCLLVLKYLIEWNFVKKIKDDYDISVNGFSFFLFQFLHIIYVVYIGAVANFGQYIWKGKTYNRNGKVD